jgi:hypothetical protein
VKARTPIVALKDWQRESPELSKKRVYNHAGFDIYEMLRNGDMDAIL